MSNTATISSDEISIQLIALLATSAHIPDLLQGAETHDPARNLICQALRYTTDRHLIHAIIEAALPATYSGNPLSEIDAMIDWAIANPTTSSARPPSGKTAAQA